MRDWVYVEDTCAALDRILHCDLDPIVGEVINIGTRRSLNILDIARLVVQKMNKPESCITFVGERPGQVFRHTADNAKAERLLGWIPSVAFEDGLDKTIRWYQDNRPWWEKQLWMREIPIITKSGMKELH